MVDYQSSNYRKYNNPNPIQRWLINRFYNSITGMLSSVNYDTLLDAGCGEGLAIQKIVDKKQDFHFYGIDLSIPAMTIAKRFTHRSSFIQGNVINLPFQNKSVELVICLEVLEHLENPKQCLAELSRVSGSYILLSVPNEPYFRIANLLRGKNLSRLGNDVGHIKQWSANGFIKFISPYIRIISWRVSFPWIIVLCQNRL